MYGINYRNYSKKLIYIFAVILAFIFTVFVFRYEKETGERRIQKHLAEEVLRFHVLANSDDENDQEQKLKVRDAVLKFLEENMPETDSAEGTAVWIREHIDEIEAVGQETVGLVGKVYPVHAAVTTCWFPEKTYGDLSFPAGNYRALRIEIGAAGGHNWWCVLYPGLCFTDTVNAVVPEEGKQKLKNVLTEEEYSSITMADKFKISWYFWGDRKK